MLSFTVVIVVLFLTIFYYYVKYVYFTLRGPIPGIPPQFLFGNLLQTGIIWGDESLANVLLKLKIKFGDVFQYWFTYTRVIIVSSLEDIQHIFAHRNVYDQGDIFIEKLSIVNPSEVAALKGAKYKRHTSVSYSLFRGSKIFMHLDTIIDCTDKLLDRWRQINDPTKIYLNMNEQTQQLLLAIFGFIAFDYDLQILDNECEKGQKELVSSMETFFNTTVRIVEMPAIIGRIYLFLNFKYRRARLIINQYIQRIIDQELKETVAMRAERKRTSLIASLISSLQQDENIEAKKREEDKRGLSRQEITGLILSLLTGGYTTISTVLSWFIHLMSKYPEVQAKIKKELAEYNHRRLSIEHIESLVYLDCVLHEILRFVPTSIGSIRTLIVDDRLPKTGVQLKKGDQIFISFYNLGRDARYWSNPDQFYPERFLNQSEEIGNNNKAALISFGGGHRQCAGQDLARFELKVICARLMQYVTFVDGGPEVNSGGYQQRDTVQPKHIGVAIKFD
ncbi:unnamed protein product [Rotaria sp. Silwood1]|nr:unnamed protein product [Rotaria sp. Silwood1]CAF1549976.1 unnamed protein product [Rotaria sp. Silwood1]CAF4653982.1 unnamed protein product [Rotaria sp. Silwood1]CAF5002487.1 unnamed protein product [Rotaria sp. Silwood1]